MTTTHDQGREKEAARPAKQVEITLDDESLVLPDRDITPNEILAIAGLDPATHYLVKLQGRQQESLKDEGEVGIRVHSNEKFISLSTGPTPTS